MHVAAGVLLAIMAVLFLIGFMGATPFIGIPVAAVLLVAPFAWAALSAKRVSERKLDDGGGVPSTEEASYTPRVDPVERP